MSEPLDVVEALRRPLETISQCRRMRYVTAELAEIAAAEIARLREERRWVPVGERLPEGEEWVDVAGLWGDSVGWHEPSGWRNVDDDPFPSGVTHWRKRGPGPEAAG